MNYKSEQLRYDEIEIGFGRIMKACKKNMKWILVCVLVCALVLPLFAYIVDLKDYKEISQAMNGEIEYAFSENDELEIENYLLLQKEKEQLELYEETSLLLELDWNDVYIGKVQFYIEAEDEKLDKITAAYINLLTAENIVDVFEQKLGVAHVNDISNMVTVEEDGSFLTIEVKAKDEELSRKYLNILKDIVFDQSKIVSEYIWQHQINVFQEKNWNTYSDEVYLARNEYFKSVDDVNVNIANIEYSLSNLQKVYIANQIDDNEGLLIELGKKPVISWLLAVLGAIGGVVVSVTLICAISLFDGKLQTKDELNKRLGISRLAVISSVDKNEVDQKLIEAMSIRIQKMLDSKMDKDVYLIGSTNVLASNQIVQICDMLVEQKIKCRIVNDILTQDDAMNEIMKKNVVLVEAVAKSKVKNIYTIANICNDLDANVIGYICIDN